MSYKIVLSAAIAAMIAPSAFAQGLTGASVTGEYRNYYGDDLEDTTLLLQGGVEFAVANDFGVGANLGFGRFDDAEDSDYTNATLHAFYMVSPTAAVGGFVARDSADNFDSTNYGIEFGGRSNTSRYEIYYGRTDLSGDNVTDEDISIFGASFDVLVGSGISLGLQYESYTGLEGTAESGATVDDVTLSDTSVIARYNVTPAASVYGEFGTIGANAFEGDTTFVSDDDIRYFGIGAEFTFGGQRGNIFGERSLAGFGF